MNIREALRSADPARRLPREPLRTQDEHLLQRILGTRAAARPDGPQRTPPPRARRDRKPLIATGLVAIAVTTGAVAAIRAVPDTTSAPAQSVPQADRALEAAVDRTLAEAAGTPSLGAGVPSLTWSDTSEGAQGGLVDLTGRSLFLAAACTGGGTVTIRIADHLDTRIDCTTPAVIGPIDLAAALQKGIGVDVSRSGGEPRFVAKAVAVPRASATTTPAVEVDGRILLVYPAAGAGGNQALLTGTLTQNAAGCIAVGNQVLIAPSNVELLPDGSLRLDGTTIRQGDPIRLGGGGTRIPSGSPCRAAAGEYFTLGDYPQPQPQPQGG